MSNKKMTRAGTIIMVAGLLLLIIAVIWVGYNLWDDYRAGETSSAILSRFPAVTASAAQEDDADSDQAETPLYVAYPEIDMPVVEIDGIAYIGRIDIPTLELSLPIISEWSYPNLKLAPCRYSGSAYQGNLIIAGHDYRSHFGPISGLNKGDRVIITDMEGNVFTYEVSEIEQLASNDVTAMTEEGDWDLTLFTCTIGGNYRYTVRCVAV